LIFQIVSVEFTIEIRPPSVGDFCIPLGVVISIYKSCLF
jgi:hypothetical protein